MRRAPGAWAAGPRPPEPGRREGGLPLRAAGGAGRRWRRTWAGRAASPVHERGRGEAARRSFLAASLLCRRAAGGDMPRQAPGAAVPCSGPRPADHCMLADPAPAAGPDAEAAAAFGRAPGLDAPSKARRPCASALRLRRFWPRPAAPLLELSLLRGRPRWSTRQSGRAGRPSSRPGSLDHAGGPTAIPPHARLPLSGAQGFSPTRTPCQPAHMTRSVLPLPAAGAAPSVRRGLPAVMGV